MTSSRSFLTSHPQQHYIPLRIFSEHVHDVFVPNLTRSRVLAGSPGSPPGSSGPRCSVNRGATEQALGGSPSRRKGTTLFTHLIFLWFFWGFLMLFLGFLGFFVGLFGVLLPLPNPSLLSTILILSPLVSDSQSADLQRETPPPDLAALESYVRSTPFHVSLSLPPCC